MHSPSAGFIPWCPTSWGAPAWSSQPHEMDAALGLWCLGGAQRHKTRQGMSPAGGGQFGCRNRRGEMGAACYQLPFKSFPLPTPLYFPPMHSQPDVLWLGCEKADVERLEEQILINSCVSLSVLTARRKYLGIAVHESIQCMKDILTESCKGCAYTRAGDPRFSS